MALHVLLGVALSACLPAAGDRILMRDLAAAIPAFANVAADESIGFTPFPGSQRRFSAGDLSRLAAKYGIAIEPEPVCFERKLAPLTREQILTAMRQTLPQGAHLEIFDFSRVSIPQGTLEFPRDGVGSTPQVSPHDPVIWRGRVQYAASQSTPVWAKVAVWVSRQGVMAARNLEPGRPIAPEDIRAGRVDLSPFAEAPAVSAEEVKGLAPRNPVPAGQPVRLSWLAPAADVIRGDIVGIEARNGAALIKYKVQAQSSGHVGETVAVRNTESGKTFRARVIRKGWVAVE